jgi:hypothetical protein
MPLSEHQGQRSLHLSFAFETIKAQARSAQSLWVLFWFAGFLS